ncbi:MAG: hypothetical protein N4A38_02010 [Candidatus Gracilibacteria bacterium]|nr:hypothetical protein [Candidatus Gracilibacteria bacterium]
MQKKYLIYIIISLVLFNITSFILIFNNNYLVNKSKAEEKIISSCISEKNINNKKLANINFFEDNFKLKNYKSTRYKITPEGKNIINNIRSLHKSPNLIKANNFQKEICAGFIYILTNKIWGKDSALHIGMMDNETKYPAKAWELPNSYVYYGGKLLDNLYPKLKTSVYKFYDNIKQEDLKLFFNKAFSEEALMGDIGFFYKHTAYLGELLKTGNYNSHITKNMGISNFEYSLDKIKNNNLETFSNALQCDKIAFDKIKNLLTNYKLKLNNKPIIFLDDNFYYQDIDEKTDKKYIGEKIDFKQFDKISFSDVTLVHYFGGAKVDSLFNMVCKGEFYPINMMSINPRFIEKN